MAIFGRECDMTEAETLYTVINEWLEKFPGANRVAVRAYNKHTGETFGDEAILNPEDLASELEDALRARSFLDSAVKLVGRAGQAWQREQ